jgi:hypothetical protein
MVQAAPKVYIFTNLTAVTAIARQRRFQTMESLENLNLRLAKVSVYPQQVGLGIRYQPGRVHLVPEILSRLQPQYMPQSDLKIDIPNDVAHGFYVIVEMSDHAKE